MVDVECSLNWRSLVLVLSVLGIDLGSDGKEVRVTGDSAVGYSWRAISTAKTGGRGCLREKGGGRAVPSLVSDA